MVRSNYIRLLWACVIITCKAVTVTISQPYIGVARSIPTPNMTLNAQPMTLFSGISRGRCLQECMKIHCPAFNYGEQERNCELLSVYYCENASHVLGPRDNYKYYDVETCENVSIADDFRNEDDCVTENRCSPKCYVNTTTTIPSPTNTTIASPTITTTTPTTTTETPTTSTNTTTPTATTGETLTTTATPPTTTNAMLTTTTTTTPTTTNAMLTTTTTPPTTTNAMLTTTTPPPTTTNAMLTTTTTTTPATTNTTSTTTTASAGSSGSPGPDWQGTSCLLDAECPGAFSYCRYYNYFDVALGDYVDVGSCECVAGYSYNPPTKTCVRPCPGSYGTTYTMTQGWFIPEHNDAVHSSVPDEQFCMNKCNSMPGCVSFEFDTILFDCNLATVSKDDVGTTWVEGIFNYYQRNCA